MKCLNCYSNNTKIFHNAVYSLNNGKVYRCKNCDLLFINPIMSNVEEKKFYKNYNQHVINRGVIANLSLDEFHNNSIKPAKERFRLIKNYFKNKKILEVGSSTGAFLSLLKESETNAVEIVEENLSYSSKFITGKSYKSIDQIENEKFDVICMFHVFEHFKNPLDMLLKFKNILSENGLIIIEVPCSDDPLLTIYNIKEFKDFYFQPMHPMIYNENSLDYIFKKASLKKQKSIYFQRYGLDNHLSWLKNKKPGGDKKISTIFKTNKKYKKQLIEINKTDTIFFIASK